jgi:hypothetical protein
LERRKWNLRDFRTIFYHLILSFWLTLVRWSDICCLFDFIFSCKVGWASELCIEWDWRLFKRFKINGIWNPITTVRSNIFRFWIF